MGNKKIPNKPIGTTGPVEVTFGASGPGIEFHKLEFPKNKEEIEQFIVGGFLREAKQNNFLPYSAAVSQNEQSDFDFSLSLGSGIKTAVELMEVAPLENLRGSYDSAPSSYKPYDFAEYIFAKIMKKSNHYGVVKSGLALLIYITDWKFTLSDTTIALLQYWLTNTEHKFHAVFCYSPIDPESGVAQLLFPSLKDRWRGFDPTNLKDHVVYNFDPNAWQSTAPTPPQRED